MARIIVVGAFAAGIVAGVVPASGQGFVPAIPAELYAPAVVSISADHTTHQGMTTRSGVGFFIGPGKFVTTRGLLYGSKGATLTFDNGTTLPITRVLAEDSAADFVIAAADVPPELRRGLAVSAVGAIAGEDVLIIGPAKKPGDAVPEHELAMVKIGAKSAPPVPVHALTGEVQAALAVGGAPVLNAVGQVVGIVVTRPQTPGVAAIASSRLHDLRETAGLALADWAGGTPLPIPDDAAAAGSHSVETRDDGSILVDKRFLLTGDGSAEKPYAITWDLLLSAMEEYVPKQGRKNLPARITMLAGKHVSITGNVTFPMMVEEPEELLAMMNPWDGCCIGVPPTPYDAVEVHLAQPIKGQGRFTNYGTLTGKLRVEPQLVGNWLVGLYVLDAAKLTPASFGGFSP
ncbi:MAG: hypothetical protein ACKVU4_15505 [Phycisphaerales bacterium]